MLIAFNKPYGVLSQFTRDDRHRCLAEFIDVPNVYPAGRLDADSEGLLLLTDDGALQDAIAGPRHRLPKRYLAQVEGVPDDAALAAFEDGLWIGQGAARYRARPASAHVVATPDLPPRDPPIRVRAAISTAWIEVTIAEGRNRQVRRMTAAVGWPTLRLVRVAIGALDLSQLGLSPGGWMPVEEDRLRHASLPGRSGRARPAPGPSPLSTGSGSRRYWG